MSRDADVRVTGLDESLADLLAALDQELPQGMLRAAQAVAVEASSNHAYTNRTGDLQAATQAGAVTGRASDGEITAEVVGDTDYGEFVERNEAFAFLEPAAARAEGRIEEEIDGALDRAAERAGWT
jgi:hypothetical protein